MYLKRFNGKVVLKYRIAIQNVNIVETSQITKATDFHGSNILYMLVKVDFVTNNDHQVLLENILLKMKKRKTGRIDKDERNSFRFEEKTESLFLIRIF